MNSKHKIPLYDESCLLAAYDWTNNTAQNVEAVMFGRFNLPAHGPIDAYAKFYNPNERGLINEITAWLLALDAGLPVPRVAFMALLPLDALPKPLFGIPFIAHQSNQTHLLAFCTINESPLGIQPQLSTKTLCDELKGWKELSTCLAFDEFVGNADRHLGNFVRKNKQDYIAIDHGRLAWELTTPAWCSQTLIADKLYENRLFNILWGYDRSSISAPKALISSKGITKSITQSTIDEIAHWGSFFVSDDDDREAWLNFITQRKIKVEGLMQQRLGTLPL